MLIIIFKKNDRVQVTIMKVLIADDETEFTHEIIKMLEKVFRELSCIASISICTDSSEIYRNNYRYDMAFLDIQMGPIDGLTLARKLKEDNNNIILFFITAYDRYLDDAMDIEAFRYLTKPVDYRRLKNSVEKALGRIQMSLISFKCDNHSRLITIQPKEIEFIEAKGHHTIVQLKEDVYSSSNPFKFWRERLLDYPLFFMVHGSFIINLKMVTEIQKDCVILDKQFIVPISYRKRAEFRDYFIQYIAG